jgi:hypothetical protein
VDAIERECRNRRRLTEERGAEPFPLTATLSADVRPDLILLGTVALDPRPDVSRGFHGGVKIAILDAKRAELAHVEETYEGAPTAADWSGTIACWIVEDLIQTAPLRPSVPDVARERIRQLIADHYPRTKGR